MGKITLFSPEAPNLKLGPGSELVFQNGYVEVDEATTPGWEEWIKHEGTPPIHVLRGKDAEVPEGGTRCPTCGKAQADKAAAAEHLTEHAPKPVPLQPADQRAWFVHKPDEPPMLVQPPSEPGAPTESRLLPQQKPSEQLIATSAEAPRIATATPTGTSQAVTGAPTIDEAKGEDKPAAKSTSRSTRSRASKSSASKSATTSSEARTAADRASTSSTSSSTASDNK